MGICARRENPSALRRITRDTGLGRELSYGKYHERGGGMFAIYIALCNNEIKAPKYSLIVSPLKTFSDIPKIIFTIRKIIHRVTGRDNVGAERR